MLIIDLRDILTLFIQNQIYCLGRVCVYVSAVCTVSVNIYVYVCVCVYMWKVYFKKQEKD